MSAAPPINWKKNLVCTWLGQFLCQAGYAAIMPFLPLFIRDRYGITDEKELGMWVSALTFFGFCSFIIANPVWGALADKYGRKLMLLRSYYSAALLFPLMHFAPSVIWLIALRFFISCFSGSITASQTLIAATTPEEHQGVAQGTLSTAVWSGNMVGLGAGAFCVDFFGYFWGFLGCGALYLVGGVITHVWVRENFVPPVKTAEKTSFAGKFRGLSAAVWVVLLLFVTANIARGLDAPYIAIFVSRLGGEAAAVRNTGIISLVAALGGLLSGVLMGKLADRFPPEKIGMPAAILSALTMIVQAFSLNLWMLGGLRFTNFLCAGGFNPVFLAMLSRISPPEKRGMLLGMAASFRILGMLLASAAGGGLLLVFGSVRSVFFGAAAVFLILIPLIALAVKDMRKNNQPREAI